MRIVGEKKVDPEREREGKPVVRMTPPTVDAVQDVAAAPLQVVTAPRQAAAMQVQVADVQVGMLSDDGDSDNPDKDRIWVQML